MELFNKGLPKWPALIVKGKPVTKDQAKEIIIRTDGLSFCSNDKEFEKDINEIMFGVRESWMGLTEAVEKKFNLPKHQGYDYTNAKREEYGTLPLEYLRNSRILSSWIGGPHGWCSWNGYIGCNNYNIGKYPDVETVFNEWVEIAKAFPFLDLRCQLLSGETCEMGAKPVVEYIVKDGKVELIEPAEQIDYPTDNAMQDVMNILHNPMRERGCTIEQLKEALEYTKSKVSEKQLN